MSATGDYSKISPQEYEKLLKRAIRVEGARPKTPDHPEYVGKRVHRPVKTQIELPFEEEVKVPVKKKIPHHATKKKVVKGKELVPVEKFEEIEETVIEVREEVVTGYRTVWKKVEEPYTKVVKKPVAVTRMKKVPYTDYEEREVEKVVEVPCHSVEEKEGYRIDKKTRTQTIDVEQDEVYELRPHLVGRGDVRIKAAEMHDLGLTSVGKECYSRDRPRTPSGPGRKALMEQAVEKHRLSRTASRPTTPGPGWSRQRPATPTRPASASRPSSAGSRASLRERRGLPGPTVRPGDPPYGSGLGEMRGPCHPVIATHGR